MSDFPNYTPAVSSPVHIAESGEKPNFIPQCTFLNTSAGPTIAILREPVHSVGLYGYNNHTKVVQFLDSFQSGRHPLKAICVTPDNTRVVYVSEGGGLYVWDLHKCTQFELRDPGMQGSLFTVDATNDYVICGGSKGFFFWNLAKKSLMGVCDDMHADDVTYVMFHPRDPTTVFTAGEDGLVNVYKVNKPSEYASISDYLDNTIPTEQPVQKIQLFGRNLEYLCAISTVQTLSLWNIEECELLGQYNNFKHDIEQVIINKQGFDVNEFYTSNIDERKALYVPPTHEYTEAEATDHADDTVTATEDPQATTAEQVYDGNIHRSDAHINPDDKRPVQVPMYRNVDGSSVTTSHVVPSFFTVAKYAKHDSRVITYPPAWRISHIISSHYNPITDTLVVTCSTLFGGIIFVTVTPNTLIPQYIIPPGLAHRDTVTDCYWKADNGVLITVSNDSRITTYNLKEYDDEEKPSRKLNAKKHARQALP